MVQKTMKLVAAKHKEWIEIVLSFAFMFFNGVIVMSILVKTTESVKKPFNILW